MEKYLFQLIEQFKSANGIKNVDINSEKFMIEFSEWLTSRRMIGNEYRTFIEDMGALPKDDCTEIGKGEYDSIALEDGIPIITPYTEGIKTDDSSIIKADFIVYNGEPIITHNGINYRLNAAETPCFRRFITQNPYEQGCINNWEQLHNTRKDVTVGVFGSIYDKDIEQKIRTIEMLRDRFNDNDYTEEYVEDGDMYYYVVYSNNRYVLVRKPKKPKELVKSLAIR